MRRLSWAVLGVLALALAACGSDAGSGTSTAETTAATSEASSQLSGTLTVLAAASLTETFDELRQQFTEEHPGVTVQASYSASSTLARQIVEGAPADVFASASTSTMKTVTHAGLADGEPAIFVRNTLQIAVPPDNPAQIATLADLARPEVKVALCEPQVPCGSAARTALTAAGVAVTPVTLEQDVKAVLTKVRLGEVDAGLVYRTDVISAGSEVTGIDFPEAQQAINDYPIAVLSDAPNPEAATAYVQLVRSPEGLAVLMKAGFAEP
jgi:molybdate transport system substrate-binding protein